MKKSKLILPIVATVGAVVPTTAVLVSMTSCNNNKTFTKEEIARGMLNVLAGQSVLQVANNVNASTMNVSEMLKQADIIIENLDTKCLTVESVTSTKADYNFQLNVTFKISSISYEKNFSLFYNDVTTKEKEKQKKSEIKTYFSGLCAIDEKEFNFECSLETETKSTKSESKTKFKLFCFDNLTDYIKAEYEKETKLTKTEYEHEYKIHKEGEVDKEYSIKVENKNSGMFVEIESEVGSLEDEYEFKRIVNGTDVTYQGVEETTGTNYKRVADPSTDEIRYELQ